MVHPVVVVVVGIETLADDEVEQHAKNGAELYAKIECL